jgi:AraC family transcriptional regulator of adaptative response / DNA-3-methyladenine glycosylase II
LSATSALIPLRSADARGGNGPRTGRSVTHYRFRAKRRDDFIETARLITPGRLNFEALGSRSPARAERTLLAVRALGPWSLAHLITRALGFSDGVPSDGTGVTNGLPALLKIEAGPTATPPDG